ncbi:MAG TPA: hypothetical protein VFU49_02100 [Ktedonobacteraceae bacterium]|nr:hypothetical protein [Ktedonobacteraceae bacterium]
MRTYTQSHLSQGKREAPSQAHPPPLAPTSSPTSHHPQKTRRSLEWAAVVGARGGADGDAGALRLPSAGSWCGWLVTNVQQKGKDLYPISPTI